MTHEFTPDWKLSQQDQLQVYLSIALTKHVPGWPGATDEQLAAVAGDLSPVVAKAIDDAVRECAELADKIGKDCVGEALNAPNEKSKDTHLGWANGAFRVRDAIRSRSQA